MRDLTKVPGPSSPLQGTSAKVIAVIVVGIVVAILKPWSGPTPPAATVASTPSGPGGSPSPSPDVIAHYNPDVFGVYEPAPDWELWPAGYLVSFGFAMRVDGGIPEPSPAAVESGAPGTSPSARPSPRATPTLQVASEPTWPSAITITASSHLAMVGVNTPLGFRIGATLVRLEADATSIAYPVLRLPSPWPTHFAVIAIDDGSGRTPRESWPTGRYRLHLRFDPGPIVRDIEIVIDERESPAAAGQTSPSTGTH